VSSTSRWAIRAAPGSTAVCAARLNPIHPTPNRDDGYDVADYDGVDPRLATSRAATASS